MPTITAGGTPQTISLPEGQVLSVSGTAGTAGVIYRLDPVLGGTNSLQSWPIGAGALAPIGPYAGEQHFLVTCSAGSVNVTVGNAVLVPPKPHLRLSNAPAYAPYGYAYVAGGGGLAAALSCHMKIDVEAGYEAIQVAKFSHQLAAGANWKCIIAGTETSDRSTNANAYYPVVGGTTYNTMRNGTTDLYGWDAVKFGGKMPFTDAPCPNVLAGCAFTVASNVVTITTPAQSPPPVVGQKISFLDTSGAGTLVGAGVKTLTAASATSISFATTTPVASGTCNVLLVPGFSAPGLILSDLVDSHAVPRGTINASDIGQTRSLIMMRSYFDGSLSNPPGDWSNILVSNDSPTAANRGRISQIAGATGVDAVTTLSTTFSAANCYTHPFIIIPHYRRRSVSVAAVGDSTFQAGFLAADGFSSWLVKACAEVSSPDLPVVPLNIGMGGATSDIYQARAKTMLSVLKPDFAVYEAFTPNDIAQATQFSVWAQERKVLDFLKFCADNGIYPILTTPLPVQTMTAQADAFRLQVRAMVLDMAGSRNVSVLDFGFIGDGATPERFNPAYNFPASPVHQNEAAMELQAAALAQLLRSLI